MKILTHSFLTQAVLMLAVLLLAGTTVYAKQDRGDDDHDQESGKTCVGNLFYENGSPASPVPTTLLSVNSELGSCDALAGEVGCKFNLRDPQPCQINQGNKLATLTFDVTGNSLIVKSTGAKISTVGFKGGGKKCLAAFANEPEEVKGLGVIKSGAYQEIQEAFACIKQDTQPLTDLRYTDARVPNPASDPTNPCGEGESFVGDPTTGRGVCVRCLSPEFVPADENNACHEDGCTNVFQMAVFDTDTKDGNLFVAECGPETMAPMAATSGAPETQFQQCDENVKGPDNGEGKCQANQEVSSSFEYYGGGSTGCGTSSGYRVCVQR